MNTAGLEWFGPPERNTLRPLCAVCLSLVELGKNPLCAASASLLYLKGGAYMAVGTPTDGPIDVVQNNILLIHYGVADKGDLSPGFPCLLLESPVQRVQVLSCRDGARHSERRHLPHS